jgi:hypothetical protein
LSAPFAQALHTQEPDFPHMESKTVANHHDDFAGAVTVMLLLLAQE